MKISKRSELLFLLSLIGCSTSIYKIDKHSDGKTQLLVTPERVVLACEEPDNYTGDVPNPRLFIIYVLDEEKTVLSLSPGNILNDRVCEMKKKDVMKVLKSGKRIFVGASGNLDEVRKFEGDFVVFPGMGRFPDNSRVLGFQVIWNENGMCYNTYAGDQKPCPNDGFPLTK